MVKTLRTRFAPSPTGYMHIGNLKAALFGYLLAKNAGGKFILRIEDTDQERIVEGAVDVIYKTLKTAGIYHDEGPDIGGSYGPYVQSERKAGYRQYAEELIAKKHAYYCFCDKARLAGLAEQGISYDRHCLKLTQEQVDVKLAEGTPHVVRQLIPQGFTTFTDEVFGEITVDNKDIEDQVLIKSDGMPTYNFANVVDDHLMQITHVLRGSEYLTSTPKYNLLYDALGWEIPKYVHLPLVLNEKGEKMSKRKGDFSFEDLLAMGFLPQAIVNYIVLLGFSPPDNREIFSLGELVEVFSVGSMSKSPAIFDMAKLRWVNSEHFKAMDDVIFFKIAKDKISDAVRRADIDRMQLAQMAKTRVSTLSEIPSLFDFIDEMQEYDIELYSHKKMKTDPKIAHEILKELLPKLEAYENSFRNDDIYEFLTAYSEASDRKNSQVLWSIRTAVSGKPATPGGASEIMALLGKAECIKRVGQAIEKLEATYQGK